MNSIAEKLWNYIDGNCTPEEAQQISDLILHNDEYKQQYAQLLQLNNEFKTIELDEPSMAFTYNVMEQIRTQEALVPLKATINKNIIRGIAAFFVLSILAIVGYTLGHINWSNQSSVQIPVPLQASAFTGFLTGPWMKGFLFFDVIAGLFLFDSYLRKQHGFKQQKTQ